MNNAPFFDTDVFAGRTGVRGEADAARRKMRQGFSGFQLPGHGLRLLILLLLLGLLTGISGTAQAQNLWTDRNSLPTSGNWKLDVDVFLDNKQWSISEPVTLDLNGKTIDSFTRTGYSLSEAVVIHSGGSLTLTGTGRLQTSILSPYAPSSNDALKITNGVVIRGGSFNLQGKVEISGFEGNAVELEKISGSTFHMRGGTISGGKNGLYAGGGDISINGGTISGADTGLTIPGSSIVTMTSGLISRNKQGVRIESQGYFKMSGGTITHNTECGIDLQSGCSFDISDRPVITENGPTGARMNVKMNGNRITVVGGLSGALIGVNTGGQPGVFTSGLPGNGDASYFSIDGGTGSYTLGLDAAGEAALGYEVSFSISGVMVPSTQIVQPGNPVTEPAFTNLDGWYKDSSYSDKWNFGSETVNGNLKLYARLLDAVASVSDGVNTAEYASLQEAFDAAKPGMTVKLLKNIDESTDSFPLTAPAGSVTSGAVTLDLNGKTIDASSSWMITAVIIPSGTALTLADSSSGGRINTFLRAVDIQGGSFTMEGGTVSGSGGGVYMGGGSFTMKGGDVSGNDEGVNMGGGSFTMKGGTVSNNGICGIFVDGGDVSIEGGEISGNTVSGIEILSGTLSLSGNPQVTSNGPENSPCNVYLPYLDSTINIAGDLDASANVGVRMQHPGVFTSGLSGRGDALNFSSDDSAYAVGINGEKEAILGTPCSVDFYTSGIGTAPEPLTLAGGSLIPEPAFSADGYRLEGWYRDGQYQTAWNFGSDTISEALTLFAQLTPVPYAISYDLAGGVLPEGADNPGIYTIESPDFTLVNPVLEGHEFLGWTGTGLNQMTKTVSVAQGSFGNRTYTAHWKPNTVNVSFNANGGEGTMDDQLFSYGVPQELKPHAFTRKDHGFHGWNTAADGSGIAYNDGQSISVTKNLTLYAQWVPGHTVTFIPNGNNDVTGHMDAEVFLKGTKHSLTKNVFVRTGYSFTGWNTAADGTGIPYGDGAEVTIDADLTLYAQWKGNRYRVRFDANGGAGTMAEQAFTWGEPQALSANGFTREGYKFIGWNLAADGSGTNYGDEALVHDLTPDDGAVVTLYAEWVEAQAGTFLITFDANDGSGDESRQQVAANTPVQLMPNQFVRPGYVFREWNTAADGTGDAYGDGAAVQLQSDLRLYAQWEEEGDPAKIPMTLRVEFVNLRNNGSRGVPPEITDLTMGPVRIRIKGHGEESVSEPLMLSVSTWDPATVTMMVNFDREIPGLAPGSHEVNVEGLPKMVYENENIIIAGVPVEGSLKWKYELSVMTEINVKDGEMIIRVWLLWDDGRRPGDEIGIYALPEDEIGAYVEYQDGTREYLLFHTYDICMAWLGSEELCAGPERCFHK